MKKIFLFFVIFTLFGVLAAQEAQNGQASEQNEPAAAAEEVKENGEAAPADVPAAENQESEAQAAPQEEEKAPETAEKPAEPEVKETENETPAPAAAPSETAEEEPSKPETAENTACGCDSAVKDEKPSKMFYNLSAGLGLGFSIFSMRVNNDFEFLLKHTAGGTDVYMGLEVDFRYSPYLEDHSIYEIPIQLNMVFDFPVNHRTIKRLDLWFSAGVDLAFGYLWYYKYSDYDDYEENKDNDTLFKALAAWGFGVNMIFKNDVTLKLGFDSFYGKYPDLICAAGYRF